LGKTASKAVIFDSNIGENKVKWREQKE